MPLDAEVVFDGDGNTGEWRIFVDRFSAFQRTVAIDFEKRIERVVKFLGSIYRRLHNRAGCRFVTLDTAC